MDRELARLNRLLVTRLPAGGGSCQPRVIISLFCLFWAAIALPLLAQGEIDWPQKVRLLVETGQFPQAQALAEDWIRAHPEDLDAKSSHARILSWQGQRQEAESEFRALLEITPTDPDLLMGLAQLLNFRDKHRDALALLNRACEQPPERPDCRLEQARTLVSLGRRAEAGRIYASLSLVPSVSRQSKAALEDLAEQGKHQLLIGGEADWLNYSQTGSILSASLASRWNARWRTSALITEYRRFGQTATGVEATATYLLPRLGAVTIGGGSAGNSGIVPKASAQIGYEQGFRISRGPVRGLEALYDQKWIWYPGTRILNFAPAAMVQLSKSCEVLLRVTATRIYLQGPPEWTPSIQTRFTFPVSHRHKAYVLYAHGAENFGTFDHVLFRSSNALGGGVVIHSLPGQEFRITLQRETIAGGRSQTSFGGAYAFRF